MPKVKRKSTKSKRTVQSEDREREATEPAVDPKETMLAEMRQAGYDGNHFAGTLEISVLDKIKRAKPPRRNRFLHYANWSHALLRHEIGPEDAQFAFPPSILAYIRHLVPGDVKGEIREDAYQVKMQEFCTAMELPEAN